jgi:hypothetical protein
MKMGMEWAIDVLGLCAEKCWLAIVEAAGVLSQDVFSHRIAISRR